MNMARGAETSIAKKRSSTVAWTVLALVIALVIAATAAFRGIGRWLVREDPLRAADAIVVLSGSLPHRAEGAAELYREGYAKELWLTCPESPATELAAMGISFTGEEQYERAVLIHSGVPAASIQILPDRIVDTEQEVREIAREMSGRNRSSVIIVTSPQHTRRVRALWDKLAEPNERAIVRAAPQDPFDRDHWWRNTHDAYSVARELLGLANTWFGLRIRPHGPETGASTIFHCSHSVLRTRSRADSSHSNPIPLSAEE
jgi:uncharacterized SAM-binding protein YcdF (DUF218 family)